MPRATRSFGRPGTRVIPARWNADHAPVVTAAMRARVSLRHDDGATTKTYLPYDPEHPETTGRTTYSLAAPYAADIPARIQGLREMTARGSETAAEESLRVSGYLVALALGVDDTADAVNAISTGDIVTIDSLTESDQLLLLPGVELRVTDIVRGTERWERDLFCQLVDTTGGGARS